MNDKIKFANKVALYAGIFTIAVAILLLINYMQIRSGSPLESQALDNLLERLAEDRANPELINEIRQLDLLARKAYFTSIWQINTGGYLLLFGAIVTIIALRVGKGLRFLIEKPDDKADGVLKTRLLTERWIAVSGIAILIGGILSTFLSVDYIGKFNVAQLDPASAAAGGNIEVVDIAIATEGVEPTQAANQADLEMDSAVANLEQGVVATIAQPATAGQQPYLLTARSILENHNSFRAPFGIGVSHHRNIPTSWDGATGTNIIWRTRLPLHGFTPL